MEKTKLRVSSLKDEVKFILSTLFDSEMSWFSKKICIKSVHITSCEYRRNPF